MQKSKPPVWFLLAIFIVVFGLSGCFLVSEYSKNPNTGEWEKLSTPPPVSLRPFGYKKLRKKTILLPGDLVLAVRKYRMEKNVFPANMGLFSNHSIESLEAIRTLENRGFTDLNIEYWSLDSCSMSWEHPRVYDRARTPKNSNIQASGVFIFTYKDSSFYSEIKLK